MSVTNFRPKIDLFDNDNHYKIIPRRLFERRSKIPRRSNTAPKLVSHERINKLRGLAEEATVLYRRGERRQLHRRTSRPALLHADEIITLRKKA